jgi:hypothetical protein
MEFDMDKWAAESAEKIAAAVNANPNTFQIPEGATEDEAVAALQQHAKNLGVPVPDDDTARELVRNARGEGDAQFE